MSPVFGAVFLWLMATILWWSGWRGEAMEDVPHWAIGIFLAIWPLALLGNVTITPAFSVNGAWIWTLVMIMILGWRTPAMRRWISVSAGILLSSIFVVLSRLAHYPSGFSQFVAPWGVAIIIGLLAAVLLRHAAEQMLAISTGFYLNEGIDAFVHASLDSIQIIHTSEWMQGWWIAILSARIVSVSAKAVVTATRKWALKIGGKRGGQRS